MPGPWDGFEPDRSGDDDELDFLDDELDSIKERKGRLEREIKAREIRAELEEDLRDEIEEDLVAQHRKELEEACEKAADEALEDFRAEVLEDLRRFGAHRPDCLAQVLDAADQALHARCTCGWNELATVLERTWPYLG